MQCIFDKYEMVGLCLKYENVQFENIQYEISNVQYEFVACSHCIAV